MGRDTGRHVAFRLASVALLLASSCYRRDDYVLTPTVVDTLLSLTSASGATTLPADGFSRLVLVARITPTADGNRRTLSVSTSAGTLIGSGGTGASITVTADATGQATFQLQASAQVETARVQAQVQGLPSLVRELAVAFVAADPDAVVRFVETPGSAPADGATLSRFSVAVSPSVPPAQRTATFTTSAGTFVPSGTVPVSASNLATGDLKSPTVIGTARVQVTVAGVTRETLIDFERATPDAVTVLVQSATVKASPVNEVTVTVQLLRDVGTVNAGTLVTLTARTEDGVQVGSFRNITRSDTNQQATAQYSPGDTSYRGPVIVEAGAEGTRARGRTTVQVVDP